MTFGVDGVPGASAVVLRSSFRSRRESVSVFERLQTQNTGGPDNDCLPPVGSGPNAILPGSTWNFQFWFRDTAAPGAGFNLSDGLNVPFLP